MTNTNNFNVGLNVRPEDLEMEGYWSHLRREHLVIDTFAFEVHSDIDVVDLWGFPIKNGASPITAERKFGWQQEHVRLTREKPFFPSLNQLEAVPKSKSRFDALLSFPGAYTYGHWPIDIAPRIELILHYFHRSELSFIVPAPFPAWGTPFLDAFGLSSKAIIPVGNGERYRADRLVLSTLSRDSDYLPDFPHRTAFQRLRSAGLSRIGTIPPPARILIRHVPQSSIGHRATLSNFNALRESLETLGFVTLCPGEMTHEDQVAAFASATIVVGEDSSALHNIIYGNRVTLIVIGSVMRKNLLHLSISKILGHTCRYVFCEQQDDYNFSCDVSEIRELVLK